MGSKGTRFRRVPLRFVPPPSASAPDAGMQRFHRRTRLSDLRLPRSHSDAAPGHSVSVLRPVRVFFPSPYRFAPPARRESLIGQREVGAKQWKRIGFNRAASFFSSSNSGKVEYARLTGPIIVIVADVIDHCVSFSLPNEVE